VVGVQKSCNHEGHEEKLRQDSGCSAKTVIGNFDFKKIGDRRQNKDRIWDADKRGKFGIRERG
jgi:hypothetical protein